MSGKTSNVCLLDLIEKVPINMTNGMHNSLQRWSIAWICCFINFMYLGVPRLSGMLYLAAITRYGATRNQASMPFVLCYTLRNASGPFIGYLSRKVEVRKLIVSGCIISSLGVGACFFAENITTVSILWGGVFGLGVGLSTILIPCVLNQHFDKYISNANGIAFGGECIAGFVLPPLFEFCLSTYGTSGSFLILSGLILHGVPAALLLKSPKNSVLDKEETSTEIADSRKDESTGISATEITPEIEAINTICNETIYPENRKGFTGTKNTNVLPPPNEENNLNVTAYECQNQAAAEKSLDQLRKKHYENTLMNSNTFSQNESTDSTLKYASNSQTNVSETIHSKDASLDPTHGLEPFHSSGRCQNSNESSSLCFNQRINTLLPCNEGDTNFNAKHYESKIQSEDPYLKTYHQRTKDFKNSLPNSNNILQNEDTVNRVNYIPAYGISAVSSINPSPVFEQYAGFRQSHNTNEFCDQSTERPNSDESRILPTDTPSMPEENSKNNAFRVFLDPTFILMLFTQSSMIFIATTFTTIIVDFSKDIGVADEQTVYVLMCYSIADILGRFCLGWVTDGGYLSNVTFSSLCYGIMGAILAAVVSFRGFVLVMIAVFVYGLFLGGLIIVGPGIVSAHIEADKINIALASRFCLFAPMSLTQSTMIGYFRDTLGSYNGIFYLLGFHSLICTILSLLIPFTSRSRERRKFERIKVTV